MGGIKIVCIGVVRAGDRGYLELQQIATDPQEVVMLQVNSYQELASKLIPLLSVTCQPAPPQGLRAHFYPRDAMLARSLRQRRVRPSVCLSGRVTRRY